MVGNSFSAESHTDISEQSARTKPNDSQLHAETLHIQSCGFVPVTIILIQQMCKNYSHRIIMVGKGL